MRANPVQVVVVSFDEPRFSGEVLAEFARLAEAGIVRLVDVLLVERRDEGSLETVPVPEGFDPGWGRVASAFFALALEDDASDAGGDEGWSLLDAVPIGATAAVGLVEHVWAGGLREAIARAGGVPSEEAWLSGEDLARLEALRAD
ncbi:MAG TPA: DUF6325 family protein [Candidatus Nanopelagicales bacterium]